MEGDDKDHIIKKLMKRIKVLEKTVDERDATITALEAEIEEASLGKKRSAYAIVQSVGSTFLDRKKKKGKSFFNKKMR